MAPGAVDYAVRHTLFRHFCGGECVDSIQPTLQVFPLSPARQTFGLLFCSRLRSAMHLPRSCVHLA